MHLPITAGQTQPGFILIGGVIPCLAMGLTPRLLSLFSLTYVQ